MIDENFDKIDINKRDFDYDDMFIFESFKLFFEPEFEFKIYEIKIHPFELIIDRLSYIKQEIFVDSTINYLKHIGFFDGVDNKFEIFKKTFIENYSDSDLIKINLIVRF